MRTIRDFINIVMEAERTPNVWYNPYREMYISFESSRDEKVFKEYIVDVAEGMEIDNSVKAVKLVPTGTLDKFAETPEGILSNDNADLIEQIIEKIEDVLMPFYFEPAEQVEEPDHSEEEDLSHIFAIGYSNGNMYWFESAEDYEVLDDAINKLHIRHFSRTNYDGKTKRVPSGTLSQWYNEEPTNYEDAFHEMDELLRPFVVRDKF